MTALDYIKRGWCQGQAIAPSGEVCAVGALFMAYRNSDSYHENRHKLAEVIGTPDLTDWNDAPERTHAEVIASFEKAGI